MATRKQRANNRRTNDRPITVGDRVRAKTTGRAGEVTNVERDGPRDQITVSYDHAPQDDYLTTPARDGAELPGELVDRERS